ncbi:hypothetical protein [Vibrio genomosp. F10]|uniref:hypothetical protein n=1 Tax=Vibrio genomosp. F10 TaxID=723171 RepID=UPI0003783E7B|nr:hypothetical protein [Vibrio genomosp. F10]OEF08912.1 hypothetical protein A1QI_15730 [Vibrio genomosp. F10 str. 9ZB36]
MSSEKYNDLIKGMAWWKLLTIAMYLNGKHRKYTYDQLLGLAQINVAIGIKGTKTEQFRTAMRANNKNSLRKRAPLIFDCTKKVDHFDLDKWALTVAGISYVENELSVEIELIRQHSI